MSEVKRLSTLTFANVFALDGYLTPCEQVVCAFVDSSKEYGTASSNYGRSGLRVERDETQPHRYRRAARKTRGLKKGEIRAYGYEIWFGIHGWLVWLGVVGLERLLLGNELCM